MNKRVVMLLLLLSLSVTACNLEGGDKSRRDSNITAQNNKDFAAVLAGPDHSNAAKKFAIKNIGKTVEFDGYVVATYSDTDGFANSSRYGVIIRAGTHRSPTGPRFSTDAITGTKDAVALSVLDGVRVHVKADINDYKRLVVAEVDPKQSNSTVIELMQVDLKRIKHH